VRTLLLVKHATPKIEPAAPASTWPLSEEGRATCKDLAAAAARFEPAFVVASREAKAAETGLRAARVLRLPFSTAEGLHEHDRRDVPFFPRREDFLARVRDFFARPSETVLGRESADAAFERFRAALDAVLDGRPTGNAIVVSHGTVIALYVSRVTGADPMAIWSSLRYPSIVALSLPERALAGTWNVEVPSPA
jgi:broad specificity phosphatase PhoE